jgi:hypothetical protein
MLAITLDNMNLQNFTPKFIPQFSKRVGVLILATSYKESAFYDLKSGSKIIRCKVCKMYTAKPIDE